MDVRGDLEALVAEAHRRAEQRALEQEAGAERHAAETVNAAREQASALLAEQGKQARWEAAETRSRILAVVDMQAKRAGLERRETLLGAVWSTARARLAALPEDPDAYLAVLRGLAAVAARTLQAPSVELTSERRGFELLTPERLESWGREDGVRYRRADEPIATLGGLEAIAGRLRVDATFETRLRQAEADMREATLAFLLGRSDLDGSGSVDWSGAP